MWTTNASIRRAFLLLHYQETDLKKSQHCYDLTVDYRAERQEHDKLSAIREVWDFFISNYCKNSFEPYGHITIEEQLFSSSV